MFSVFRSSEWTASADDPDEYDHYCDYQQDMYETADRKRGNQAKKPEDDEDNCNCIEHFLLSVMMAMKRHVKIW